MSNDRHTPDIARGMASAASGEPEAPAIRVRENRLTDDGTTLVDDTRPEFERPGPAFDDRRPSHEGSHDDRAAIFGGGEADGYRTQWDAIQTGFVDEPRHAVEEADGLVAEVVKRLAEMFADERTRMESAWERNESVSTEDLRQAMQRYRSFFERLLTV